MIFANQQSGIIKLIILIIIALIVLGYFGYDLRTIVNSEPVQKNITYAKEVAVDVWNSYLEKPTLYIWNDIFINILWNTFVSNMDRIKAGQATDVYQNSLNLPETRTVAQ